MQSSPFSSLGVLSPDRRFAYVQPVSFATICSITYPLRCCRCWRIFRPGNLLLRAGRPAAAARYLTTLSRISQAQPRTDDPRCPHTRFDLIAISLRGSVCVPKNSMATSSFELARKTAQRFVSNSSCARIPNLFFNGRRRLYAERGRYAHLDPTGQHNSVQRS